MRLKGKTALITGAAGGVEGQLMGFGGAAARMFAREGANVVLADLKEELGQSTASQIREAGGDAIAVRLDVTSEGDWAEAVRHTVSVYGKLDILVNNAGIGSPETLENTDVDGWDALMAVHAKGTFLGTKQVIPELLRAGGGSIVNVSSIYGIVGSPFSAAYASAKGAVRLFTKSAAIQYAKDGIRVNSVHPGFALTPLNQEIFADRQSLQSRLARVPMGRLASVDEIAYGILYLASDESSFVTGAELVIDGGMTAQ